MTLQIVSYRAVSCDHDGCPNGFADKDVTDATLLRVKAAMAGWAYQPNRASGRGGARGGSISRDYCPDHAAEVTA